MKLVSYIERTTGNQPPEIRIGALLGNACVVDLRVAQTWAQGARGVSARLLPPSMLELLSSWQATAPYIQDLLDSLPGGDCFELKGAGRKPVAVPLNQVLLLPPLPNILTLRHFNVFEEHVRNIYRQRSRAVPGSWYDHPTYEYTNPLNISGADQAVTKPANAAAFDYGIEVACVIHKQGKHIHPENAYEYIAGYCIVNNWGIRDNYLSMLEAGLGTAVSSDFATTLGPALVTPDELHTRAIEAGDGSLRYDLDIVVRINGLERTKTNLRHMNWSFSDLIAAASRYSSLYPGDVISTGIVNRGCLFEQDGLGDNRWLKTGDRVDVEIAALGHLETQIL